VSAAQTHIWCPACKRRVLQLAKGGEVKIRTKILVFKAIGGHGIVVCQHCGSDVRVDIRLGVRTATDLRLPKLIIKGRKS
jgi:Zn finger protein HypA/HybF involved in hydrogenase expression